MQAVSLLYRHRHVLFSTTVNDIKTRYLGTFFGLAWAVIFPLIFLAVFATVNINIFKVRLNNVTPDDYVLLVFAGLIPFLVFSEGLTQSVSSVVVNSSLVKNTLFPIDLIPAKSVLTTVVTLIVGLTTILTILAYQGKMQLTWLLIPVVAVLQLMLSMGIGWILSALNVFFRDLSTLMSAVVLLLMMVSPIGYIYSMIPADMMPYMYPNPLYYLIGVYRGIIIDGAVPFDLLWVLVPLCVLTFFLGHALFARLKPVFPDFL